MIPAGHITRWAKNAPWPTREQVEQDLVLSRLIVEIANHPLLGDELVFRGGTCLHKLHLSTPRRYSEDLDYVRVTSSGIGPVLDALREVGDLLDLEARTQVSQHPKVQFRSTFSSGAPMRVKVEINTYETGPARPLIRLPHTVESPWWSGRADVQTFASPELVATKLRALHQRRKGRDLFDLWLALTEMRLDPDEIVACFAPYRPDGYDRAAAEATLAEHVSHTGFRGDVAALTEVPGDYDIDAAAALIRAELLARL